MSINVIPVANPHTKMEGIQNVRPKEIEKLLDKAKNMPIKEEGDFVKLQNYSFEVDVFEEMENPKKGKKNDKKQTKECKKDEVPDEKEQGNLDQSQVSSQNKNNKKGKEQVEKQIKIKKPNQKQIEKVEKIEKIENNDDEPQNENKEPEDQIEEKQEVNEQQESEVDENDMEQQLEEVQQQNDEESQQNDSQIKQSVISQQSNISQQKKKFQSNYAAMMDDLLNESEVSIEQPKQGEKSEQKVQDASQIVIDVKKEQDYLKIIKQYQVKIKKLNEELEQRNQPIMSQINEEQLDELQEQLDKTEESISNKKHLYPGLAGIGISLYDEFRLPQLVEEQVQFRLQELGVQDQAREDNEQKLQELQEQHQRELDEMNDNYQQQLNELKKQLQMQQNEKMQIEQEKEIEESHLSRILSKKEIQQLMQDPQYSLLSSNLVPSVDSNISEALKEESMYLKYHEMFHKGKNTEEQRCLEIINSKIYDFVTAEEAKELMQQDTDSNISISNVMGINQALKLMQPQQLTNSDIDSLINPEEQAQLRMDPRYQEETLPNSSIEFSVDDNEKLRKMIDSDESNFNMKVDENGSLFLELQSQIEQQFQISDSNRLIVYQQVAEKQKLEFEKQLRKLQQSKHPYKKQFLSKHPSNSSIGSLAQESIPKDMSSNISGISKFEQSQSIIGSIISEKEKQQLKLESKLQQKNESSVGSLIESKITPEDIQQISSDISQLNSLVSGSNNKQSISSGISKILNEPQSRQSKYSSDSSLNISQGSSSVKSYLLLKKQLQSKQY